MQILFTTQPEEEVTSPAPGLVFLSADNWDDYSFKTSFDTTLIDRDGKRVELGTVKIGYVNQPVGWTKNKLPTEFDSLPTEFFSVGQDVRFYRSLMEQLTPETRSKFLSAIRDVAHDENVLNIAKNQKVFKESLTRGLSVSTIRGQFRRVLEGQSELTDFRFIYRQLPNEKIAAVELDFHVKANSIPSTNIHVLIGRNGVGKTTLLNNMVSTLMGSSKKEGDPDRQFFENQSFFETPLERDYFSCVVSVSFSAFDPFVPPADKQDRIGGPGFFYIGMKNSRSDHTSAKMATPKTNEDLVNDFVSSFKSCLSQPTKRQRWLKAVRGLESDVNFADMALGSLIDFEDREAVDRAHALAYKMSSGHSIVLLTITRLVDTVDEKTLVLLDEPESHLHPPLLSAFTRALSDLLHDRNGVAIIATHSPVVLQEVPKSCVWKLTRIRAQGRSDRPERETFGENVGVLTREVFGLEVSKSGFHEMLQRAVNQGGSFEQILSLYDDQLGTEAKAILLSLISSRDAVNSLR